MYSKQLSVIIVNYNVRFFLEQCLYSVQAASEGLDIEIIVVDNHSSDGSVSYLRPLFPEVLFIENKDNPGFAKANNQAIRISKGEYILLLNPDTFIGEECLRQLCYFMENHPETGALGVKMIDGSGSFLPESKRSFPSPATSFYKLFGLSRLFPHSRKFSRYSLNYLDPNETHQVEVLSGAFLFTRHEVLAQTGLFDESFFMYGEDIDLSYRIVLQGYINYYLPERILHYKGESTRHHDIKYIRAFYDAMSIFYKKYYPDANGFTQWLVRTAISFKTKVAAWFGRKDRISQRPLNSKKKALVFCKGDILKEIEEGWKESADTSTSFVHWNIGDRKPMEAISRQTQIQGFTDIVFSYPDLRFEQMLLFMDTMPNKRITYHVYNRRSGRMVSPGGR